MEPIWGLILYLFLLAIVVAVAAARKLAWGLFLLLTPAAGVGLAMVGSAASGGRGGAAGLMAFSSILIALFAAFAMKSREQKLIDGDPVDGYKKCPHCAEQVRSEAIKCKHCGSDLSTTSTRETAASGQATTAQQGGCLACAQRRIGCQIRIRQEFASWRNDGSAGSMCWMVGKSVRELPLRLRCRLRERSIKAQSQGNGDHGRITGSSNISRLGLGRRHHVRKPSRGSGNG